MLGNRAPRHRSVPAYSSTAGDEAVELAELAGLFLDPWQQDVLRDSLGERPDGKWVADSVGVIVPRQNGKGSILEARELAGLFLFGEELIIHSAHNFVTAMEAFRRLTGLVENTPELMKRVKSPGGIKNSHGEEGIELKTGQRVKFKTRTKGGGRGLSGDLVILDEAYELPATALSALLPTLSARPNPQVWYTSSAPLIESESLRRLCLEGRAGTDSRLAFFEWCAAYGVDPRDEQAWADANPGLGIRLTEEFTERELKNLAPEDFLRERLGIWREDALEEIFPREAWRASLDVKSMVADPVAFAVDVAPGRDWASIALAGRRTDGRLHGEVVRVGQGTNWVATELAALVGKYRACAVVIDPGGPAGSLLPELTEKAIESDCVCHGAQGITVVTAREHTQACGALFDAVVQDQFRHIGQDELDAALAGAARRNLSDAWAWDRRHSGVNISPLVAVTLAAYGFSVHGPAPDYDVLDSVAI